MVSSYKGFVTIVFGRYPQASKNENALIEWLVLKNDGSKALLISKYALDCQRYNTSGTDITWETCTLRRWLNGTFISNAFSHEEQAMILSTTTESADTKDRVFLLSEDEAREYFSSDSTRQCQGTAYCFAQGGDQDSDGRCSWWLRSPGGYFSRDYVSIVDNYGAAGWQPYHDTCRLPFTDGIAVRPALWIDLGS